MVAAFDGLDETPFTANLNTGSPPISAMEFA